VRWHLHSVESDSLRHGEAIDREDFWISAFALAVVVSIRRGGRHALLDKVCPLPATTSTTQPVNTGTGKPNNKIILRPACRSWWFAISGNVDFADPPFSTARTGFA
jgi:hypothetical protein